MIESHIKIEEINSVTITPKKVYSYEYQGEKTEEYVLEKKWFSDDVMDTKIIQHEQYNLVQIEPNEPVDTGGYGVYYGNGSGVSETCISSETFENSKNFLDVLCGGYKNDGKVIYELPHARFELIDESNLNRNYIKYFETTEDAKKFVTEILDKSKSKFTII